VSAAVAEDAPPSAWKRLTRLVALATVLAVLVMVWGATAPAAAWRPMKSVASSRGLQSFLGRSSGHHQLLGAHCKRLGYLPGRGAAPALLGSNTSKRSGRAAVILRRLWACGRPAGVRAVGQPVPTAVPHALQLAVREGADAVRSALQARSADVAEATINWGSGGSQVGRPAAGIDAFLRRIFRHIETLGLSVRVSTQDLFHGHIFVFPPAAGGRSGELGIFFHAKEYPEDIPDPKGVGSGFNTSSPGYANRNLLYLASTNRVYVVDPLDASGKNHCLLQNLDIQEFLPDWASPERLLTVTEQAFFELGQASRLPDINYLPRDVSSNSDTMVLFTKGFD